MGERVRWRRALGAVAFVGVAFVVVALLTIKSWLYVALDPGVFDPAATPAAPDYEKPSAWAALPSVDDDADVFLQELPAAGRGAAAADVFFVHPTTALGKLWNARIDDPVVMEATAKGATLIQASAFNACCAVYAPRYRQANGKAFVEPNADGNRAIDVAFSDVAAAFDAFMKQRGAERPFVVASHSQGSVMAMRLLREKIWNGAAKKNLVAAYLIGGPVTRASLGDDIPVCSSEEQWGCVVAWNARGARHQDGDLDFKNIDLKSRICVNPLSWKNDDVLAPASKNEGALFFDADKPQILPGFVDATCRDGKLLISTVGEMPKRDIMSRLLLWVTGPDNYHPIEVQLYYVNLRKNAVKRVQAYLRDHP